MKRTRALKVAGFLNNETYDPRGPVDLNAGAPTRPAEGSATVVGDGVQLALAMTGGTARADAHLPWSIAAAAAANGKKSHAQSVIGISTALNSDALGLTWFGSPLDMTKVLPLLELAEADDLIELSKTNIPAFKEVSCYGVYARASAEGLGSCTNILGTIDYYRDHKTGQRQYALTDVTSLIMGGNDALIKQLGNADSPFMQNLMKNLTTEEGRLKFAKDFVRFTSTPITDQATGKTHTAYWLTSDYGLTAPLVIEFAGYQLTLFPEVEINGTKRPNLIGLPELKKLGNDASRGLLPKISLVEFALPFGLGKLSLDEPFNPIATATKYRNSITLGDDLNNLAPLGALIADGWNSRNGNNAQGGAPTAEPVDATVASAKPAKTVDEVPSGDGLDGNDVIATGSATSTDDDAPVSGSTDGPTGTDDPASSNDDTEQVVEIDAE